MSFIATTIKEHIQYQSKIEGKIEGKIKGKIETLESLHAEGILSKEQYEQKVAPLRLELKKHLGGEDGGGEMKSDHLTVVQ
ncbi:MAG: hypothetical protein GY859_16990 [Desulfobacterales bacterium]|nr:hypothetical protein [Desulfobacterales bacterium]